MDNEAMVVGFVIERYIQAEQTSTVREIADGLKLSVYAVKKALVDEHGITRSDDLDSAFEYREAADKHYGTFAPTKVYKVSVWYPKPRTLARMIRELRSAS